MKINLIAPNLLLLKYTGESSATLVVDGGGGTAGAGLITLTDATAHAFDLGVAGYDTQAELVAGINALTDWSALSYGTSPISGIFGSRDISGADILADVASVAVPHLYTAVCPFASATVVVDGTENGAVITQGIPIQASKTRNGKVSIELAVTGNVTPVEGGSVTVFFGRASASNKSGGVFPSLALADFSTQDGVGGVDVISVIVPDSGVSVSEIVQLEVGSSEFIAPISVSNTADGECQIEVNYIR